MCRAVARWIPACRAGMFEPALSLSWVDGIPVPSWAHSRRMSEHSTPSSKINRVENKYGLDDLGDTLVRDWERSDAYRKSLRELAHYVNQQILQAHAEDRGVILSGTRTDDMADALATDQSGIVAEELQQLDLDADMLANDFVTYQTVYRYLNQIRGVEYTKPDITRPDLLQRASVAQKVYRTRLTATLESASNRCGNPDVTDVDISVTVPCPSCDDRAEVSMFIAEACCTDCASDGVSVTDN